MRYEVKLNNYQKGKALFQLETRIVRIEKIDQHHSIITLELNKREKQTAEKILKKKL